MAIAPVMALMIISVGASLPEITLLNSIFKKRLVMLKPSHRTNLTAVHMIKKPLGKLILKENNYMHQKATSSIRNEVALFSPT